MKYMDVHKALQYYFALCYVTQAEYSPATAVVSEIVARYLFEMKDGKGTKGIAKREAANFRLFWANKMTNMN